MKPISRRERATGQSKRPTPVTASALGHRIDQVALVLSRVLEWTQPADQCLSSFFRGHPKLGGRDRAEIAQAVFNVLRHLRRYRREAQSGQGPLERLLALRGLAAALDPDRVQALLSGQELAWITHCNTIDTDTLPFEVRFSLPDWLAEAIKSLTDGQRYAQALLAPAPLDLRVNEIKASRDEGLAQIQALVAGTQFSALPTPYSPRGIRLGGHPPLNRWALYEQGVIEVQDEGSQLLTELLAPRRGEMVVDFCAGAGGKTLGLGALMRSTGRLYAFDVSAARLARAKPRIARSGLSNVHPVAIRGEGDDRVARLAGKAHRVLVDAPCTGVGTLRRNPDLKWRQTPQEMARLLDQQASILRHASRLLRPGGRLVYATCSFLPEENEQQVLRFLDDHPDFGLLNASDCLPTAVPGAVDDSGMLHLRPDLHQTDGFFAAVLQKKP